jgi:hypothetical protein
VMPALYANVVLSNLNSRRGDKADPGRKLDSDLTPGSPDTPADNLSVVLGDRDTTFVASTIIAVSHSVPHQY